MWLFYQRVYGFDSEWPNPTWGSVTTFGTIVDVPGLDCWGKLPEWTYLFPEAMAASCNSWILLGLELLDGFENLQSFVTLVELHIRWYPSLFLILVSLLRSPGLANIARTSLISLTWKLVRLYRWLPSGNNGTCVLICGFIQECLVIYSYGKLPI